MSDKRTAILDDLPRVNRGGSWLDSYTGYLRASPRTLDTPTACYVGIGFRTAQRVVRMTGKGRAP